MDAQRGLSVSGHRNTVLCLHLTSDTYHVTPSGRAPRARGKFWIRRVKLRIFRPDPKSHKSEGFPAAQIFKTHKCQNTYCRSAHFSKAVKFVGAQNPRGTPCTPPSLRRSTSRLDSRARVQPRPPGPASAALAVSAVARLPREQAGTVSIASGAQARRAVRAGTANAERGRALGAGRVGARASAPWSGPGGREPSRPARRSARRAVARRTR